MFLDSQHDAVIYKIQMNAGSYTSGKKTGTKGQDSAGSTQNTFLWMIG